MLGPVFAAEMVTSMRRSRYFFLRILYALILLVTIGICYSSIADRFPQPTIAQAAYVATSILVGFIWLQLAMILVVAPGLAAGTIAVERQRRTIEYLFATDLSNREIVRMKNDEPVSNSFWVIRPRVRYGSSSQRVASLSSASSMRDGASRKSLALVAGGVSSTIRSSGSWRRIESSWSFSIAMYSCEPASAEDSAL